MISKTTNGEKWRKMAMANLPFSSVKFAISPLPPPPPQGKEEARREEERAEERRRGGDERRREKEEERSGGGKRLGWEGGEGRRG